MNGQGGNGGAPTDVLDEIDAELEPWWRPIAGLLADGDSGMAAVFDAHTHIGQNDPDEQAQTLVELLAALAPLHARAAVFPMHEPDGYTAANDEVMAAAADNPETLVAYCRVDPREPDGGAVAEARRCLDSGARGIKLHPRAERFGLDEPAVEGLVQLAHERRAPVLIHAGRGIPALGRNALRLAGEYPDARLILAHAAVSDLAWLWCEMPSHPNLLIDTSWWSPGDLIELFTLVPAGQIVWASDSPYGRPLTSAVMHLRYALQAGLGVDELRSIAGGQMERLLAGEELRSFDSAPGEADHLHPHLERIVSHLTAAMGAALYGGEKSELLSLALLACDVEADDENADLIRRIEAQLQLATELATEEDPAIRFPPSLRLNIATLTIARTPAAPLPS
ncbi:MAG: amidohydrolase family protein [Solirubrobacterales bacterium]|nr:amidohydrolase family protein [Solirubrobacterales bacterium]MCB8971101.1 amidohydrolase family protein [Thermoleophilales bacterium]MCO5327901.1 amidohydrolase family protein [Solirubrobacterales bacterium]